MLLVWTVDSVVNLTLHELVKLDEVEKEKLRKLTRDELQSEFPSAVGVKSSPEN